MTFKFTPQNEQTPAQRAAYAAQREAAYAANKLVAPLLAAIQLKINALFQEAADLCEEHGVPGYLSSGTYGTGVTYYPTTEKFDRYFDADGNVVEHADEEGWQRSDTGWLSSSAQC